MNISEMLFQNVQSNSGPPPINLGFIEKKENDKTSSNEIVGKALELDDPQLRE